ncbi:biofilm regulation diguanylate cyclase SiaD [Salinicola sp. CR57]|uniref:biofilm regulation diguanylate cyclase SiaD n=1 Tax=Salinicola sp. CR57 TaxID=1949086 RepID=UPI001E4E85AB|nr:biofilm regulation diguanylate cyclase SiaD [Salinicola sp. CR57]
MTSAMHPLLEQIEALLAAPDHRDHPLHAALGQLYRLHVDEQKRLERLLNIADGYQQFTQTDLASLKQQYERQLNKERKLSRISDRYQQLMRERNQALKTAATHDPLTGLANRRLMDEQLIQAGVEASQSGKPFCVAMLDIDHFKQINDRYGHDGGDRILVSLADSLRDQMRAGDLCGRWGGEEFVLLMQNTSLEQAGQIVARLIEYLRNLTFAVTDIPVSITVSIGVAEHSRVEAPLDTVNRADRVLLEAKQEGRNSFRLAG